jgi:uncharacterized protein (DUF2342 family)
MTIYESVRALAGASGDGAVDWRAVADAAKASTDPGSLDLADDARDGYARDVRDARDRVRDVSGLGFDLPDRIEVQNRHHWIDANVETFRRALRPLDDRTVALPGVARTVNSATMAVTLGFFASNVLGQYDPLLLADTGDGAVPGPDSNGDHALYFVHPNVEKVADELGVDRARFRRWIAFHEVSHAAEFGAAPWLADYLENRLERGLDALTDGRIRSVPLQDLTTAMTAVEGYAELLMDRAFDDEYEDLREKLEARRRGGDPATRLLRRLLGFGLKRQQYERGKAFFDAVADASGVEAAGRVWQSPEYLPTDDELDDPARWLRRVRA